MTTVVCVEVRDSRITGSPEDIIVLCVVGREVFTESLSSSVLDDDTEGRRDRRREVIPVI